MQYRALRSVKLPKNKQILIKSTCLDFTDQPSQVQEKIINLCAEAGGVYCHALFDIMTKGKTISKMALNVPCGVSTLERAQKRFYEMWNND